LVYVVMSHWLLCLRLYYLVISIPNALPQDRLSW